MRWTPALNAFTITFADRWPTAEPTDEVRRKHRSGYIRADNGNVSDNAFGVVSDWLDRLT
jgi:hypothetical protein